MLQAWIIWLLSTLFMFYKYAIEVSPSIMTSDLMREFSLTGAQMGNFAACYFYAYFLLQIPAGLLLDRLGPRRVATTAIVICALGVYLLSIAEIFYVACLGRFLTGIGAAFAAVNCIKLIANWFPANRYAFMMGLMMTLAMLGAVGGQAPLASFISYLGWRHAMDILALAAIVLAALFVLIVRDRPHTVRAKPQEAPVLKTLKKVLSERQSWYLSLYSGFAFAPVSAFGGLWGVPFLTQTMGFSHHTAARASSLIFLGFAFGAPLFGWFSDKIGKRRPVMFWGTLIATFSLALVLYAPALSPPLVFFFLFLFGFAISSFLLCFSMIKESHLAIMAGTSFGFMNAFDALFGAFSDPLTGKILDLWWTGTEIAGVRIFPLSAYHSAFILLMAYLVLSLLLLKPIRETHCKQAVSSGMP